MTKTTTEVQVVRFFESAPIESAEIVYNIIADKMERRLKEKSPSPNPVRRRRSKSALDESPDKNETTEAVGEEPETHTSGLKS